LVETLEYNFTAAEITAICKDISYMMEQYTLVGDRDSLPSNWSSASSDDRLYLYLCDRVTGTFADGSPGKVFISRDQAT